MGVVTSGLRRLTLPLSKSDTFVSRSERLLNRLPSEADFHHDWPEDLSSVAIRSWNRYICDAGFSELAPAHTDIWPQNLILGMDRWWVIDFDDMALASPQLDIGSTLSELAILDDGTIDYGAAANLLRGYGQSDPQGLNAVAHSKLTSVILGLYASWIACDMRHNLPFKSFAKYYKRLKALDREDVHDGADLVLSEAIRTAAGGLPDD